MTNPRTGKPVDVGKIVGVEPDPDELTLRDLSVDPISARGAGPSKEEQAQAVIVEIAADGEWHRRSEAEQACTELGHTGGTFGRAFVNAPVVTREDETARGKPVMYRLTRMEDE